MKRLPRRSYPLWHATQTLSCKPYRGNPEGVSAPSSKRVDPLGGLGETGTESPRRAGSSRGRVLSRADSYGYRHSLRPCLTADRKSTRLNSSHANISYAVFCLKKKNSKKNTIAHTNESTTSRLAS